MKVEEKGPAIHYSLRRKFEAQRVSLDHGSKGKYVAADLDNKGNVAIGTDPKTLLEQVVANRLKKVSSKKPSPPVKAPPVPRPEKKVSTASIMAAEQQGLKPTVRNAYAAFRMQGEQGKPIAVLSLGEGKFRLVFADQIPEGTEPLRVIGAETGGKSIVKPGYKKQYTEAGRNDNGDELASAMAAFVSPGGKLDLQKLERVADANGIDTDRYNHLNPGQVRMNIGNRLRAILRSGKSVKVGDAQIEPYE